MQQDLVVWQIGQEVLLFKQLGDGVGGANWTTPSSSLEVVMTDAESTGVVGEGVTIPKCMFQSFEYSSFGSTCTYSPRIRRIYDNKFWIGQWTCENIRFEKKRIKARSPHHARKLRSNLQPESIKLGVVAEKAWFDRDCFSLSSMLHVRLEIMRGWKLCHVIVETVRASSRSR